MKKRNVLNSPRLSELKSRRRKVFIIKIALAALLALIVFGGLAYVAGARRLNITSVEVAGNKVVDRDVVKKAVEAKIAGKYLWLFPKTNIFLYPKNKIKRELGNDFKRLKDIEISVRDNTVLQLTVQERAAAYLWCETEEKCYFMDTDGFIFDEAPYFSGEVYFKFYGPVSYGSYFLKETFEKFIPFKKTLEDMGLKPVGLSVLGDGELKIFLSSSSSARPEILLKTDADREVIAENLQAALTTEPLQSDFKNKYSSLLYIDLRFGNKVYYKFK